MKTDGLEARNAVERIQQDFRTTPERSFRSLAGALKHLSEGLYSKRAHFIFELIQNADDNAYDEGVEPELLFDLRSDDPTETPGAEGSLVIRNNESGFRLADVEALCEAGSSTKKKTLGYIGEKGIGFKSVFTVSRRPHVLSNGFSFFFEQEPVDGSLPYLCPHWFDGAADVAQGTRTTIILPLKAGARDFLQKELLELDPSTLLFLNKLRRLNVSDQGRPVRSMTFEVVLDRAPDVRLVALADGAREPIRYWLFRRPASRPQELSDPNRPDVREVSLTIALSESGAGAGKVFVYLPTEVESGLPFLINADFLTTSSRGALHLDNDWNKWIRDEFGSGLAEALLSLRRLADEPREGSLATILPDPGVAYRLVPDPSQIRELAFFAPLWERAHDRLRDERFVLCSLLPCGNERLQRPADTRRVPKALRALLELEDDPCPRLGVDFGVVDPCLDGASLERPLAALGVRNIGSDEVAALLEPEWIARRSAAWFISLFDYLAARKWHLPKGKQILPTEVGLATREDPVFCRGKDDVVVPPSLSSLVKLRLLRADLAESITSTPEAARYLAEEFRLRPLKPEEVIIESLIPNLTGESPSVLLEATRYIARCWTQLSDESRKGVRRSLPILLDPAAGQAPEAPLVLPVAFSGKEGWSLVFRAGPDRAHLRVLSDDYASIPEVERKEMFTLLRDIGGRVHPPAAGVSGSWYQRPFGAATRTWAYEIARGSTRDTDVSDFNPPGWLTAPDANELPEVGTARARALLNWLKMSGADKPCRHEWERLEWERTTARWFHRTSQISSKASSFLEAVETSAWVPTTQGFKRPAEACADNNELRSHFGEELPYLAGIPDDLIGVLVRYGLIVGPTPSMALRFLRALSRSATTLSSELAQKLYGLVGAGGVDSAPVAGEKLIFMPGTSPSWHDASQVIWSDTSAVLGNRFPCVSKKYPTLKDLFVTKWGVREDASPEAYLDAWRSLPTQGWDQTRTERALTNIYSKVKAVAGQQGYSFRGLPVWTVEGRFASGLVFLPDDPDLEERFRGLIPFAWLPAKAEPASLERLFSALGVRHLQGAVAKEVITLIVLQDPKPTLLTTGALKFLRFALWKELEKDPVRKAHVYETLGKLTEETFKVLVVRYSLGGTCVDAADLVAFLDGVRLYIGHEADPEETRQEAARLLSAVLLGRPDPQTEDLVFRCLTVTEAHANKEIRRRGLQAPPGESTVETETGGEDDGETQADDSPEPSKARGADAGTEQEQQERKASEDRKAGPVTSGAEPATRDGDRSGAGIGKPASGGRAAGLHPSREEQGTTFQKAPEARSAKKKPDTSFLESLWNAQGDEGAKTDMDESLPQGGPKTKESVGTDLTVAENVGPFSRTRTVSRRMQILGGEAQALVDKARLLLTSDYQGRCQVCWKTFRQANGDLDLVVVQIQPVVSEKGLPVHGNLLGLCAWHAALFQRGRFRLLGVNNDEFESKEDLLRMIQSDGEVRETSLGDQVHRLPIRFFNIIVPGADERNEDDAIHFCPPHWLAFREAIERA